MTRDKRVAQLLDNADQGTGQVATTQRPSETVSHGKCRHVLATPHQNLWNTEAIGPATKSEACYLDAFLVRAKPTIDRTMRPPATVVRLGAGNCPPCRHGCSHHFSLNCRPKPGKCRKNPVAGCRMIRIVAYDAYGNNLGFDPATALTTLLYSGEQFDQRIVMQYLRARYYDPGAGRFNRLDPFFGRLTDPQSLHKYLYVHGDPVQGVDPSGQLFLGIGGLIVGAFAQAGLRGTRMPVLGAILGFVTEWAIWLGYVQASKYFRYSWGWGHVTKVNIYVTQPTEVRIGENGATEDLSADPVFKKFRANLLAKRTDVANKLKNATNGRTLFEIHDCATLPGAKMGYDSATETLHIPVVWSDAEKGTGQGLNGESKFTPKGFKKQVEWHGDLNHDVSTRAVQTVLANALLHETAHILLERAWVRQYWGARDHQSTGLMAARPIYVDMTRKIHDFDDNTKSAINAALGFEWGWP